MDDSRLYDFCLDWQMHRVSKKLLCKRFVEYGWDFNHFKASAETRFWFVNSMYALLYASDFSE